MVWSADIVRAHCSDGFYSIVVGILLKSPSGFTQKCLEIYSIVPAKVLNFIYLHKSRLCGVCSSCGEPCPACPACPSGAEEKACGGAVSLLARPECSRIKRLVEACCPPRGRALKVG